MSISPSVSSDSTSTAIPTVYQLRAVLHAISPLIWRRLLVPAATSIAELHTILQTVFGWEDEHLHRFVIHGAEYGMSYLGGPDFRDDARQVQLAELGLRVGVRRDPACGGDSAGVPGRGEHRHRPSTRLPR